MDIRIFQRGVRGRVTLRGDAGYEELRHDLVWNGYKPARRPEVIVQAAGEADAVAAMLFARSAGLAVAVRGGGHNWSGFSQREGGLLLDLSRLTAASVDVESRTAAIGPGISGLEFSRLLSGLGLAFPVGHHPSLPMSGFLLGGGLGWNANTWRPGCFSVESARVVTADGSIVVANETENPDLLWAVRGAGPGFFGTVTQYVLRLHREPRRPTSNTYHHPMSSVDKLATWFERAVTRLPEAVEASISIVPAPPDLAEAAEPDNGYVCVLAATAFVDSLDEARTVLAVLDESPVLGECLKVDRDQLTPIGTLLEASAPRWPAGMRYAADTAWSDSPAEMIRRTRDYHLRAPSRRSFTSTWFSTGPEGAGSPQPDAAYSMGGRALTRCYAVWADPAQDGANERWHRAMIDDLDPLTLGHHVGEADIANYPVRHRRSFQPENWRRLGELRRRYDPEALFHGPFADGEA